MFEYVCVSYDKVIGAEKFVTDNENAVYTWLDSEFSKGKDVVVQVVISAFQYNPDEWLGWIIKQKDENTFIAILMELHQ